MVSSTASCEAGGETQLSTPDLLLVQDAGGIGGLLGHPGRTLWKRPPCWKEALERSAMDILLEGPPSASASLALSARLSASQARNGAAAWITPPSDCVSQVCENLELLMTASPRRDTPRECSVATQDATNYSGWSAELLLERLLTVERELAEKDVKIRELQEHSAGLQERVLAADRIVAEREMEKEFPARADSADALRGIDAELEKDDAACASTCPSTPKTPLPSKCPWTTSEKRVTSEAASMPARPLQERRKTDKTFRTDVCKRTTRVADAGAQYATTADLDVVCQRSEKLLRVLAVAMGEGQTLDRRQETRAKRSAPWKGAVKLESPRVRSPSPGRLQKRRASVGGEASKVSAFDVGSAASPCRARRASVGDDCVGGAVAGNTTQDSSGTQSCSLSFCWAYVRDQADSDSA